MRVGRRRQPPRPGAVLGRAGRPAAAARLGRALPPGLGGPDDRGPRRRRPGPRPRSARSAAPSDHGVSKSLYGADPDGNEFEIMWRVPREAWGEYEEHGRRHAARPRRRGRPLGPHELRVPADETAAPRRAARRPLPDRLGVVGSSGSFGRSRRSSVRWARPT